MVSATATATASYCEDATHHRPLLLKAGASGQDLPHLPVIEQQ